MYPDSTCCWLAGSSRAHLSAARTSRSSMLQGSACAVHHARVLSSRCIVFFFCTNGCAHDAFQKPHQHLAEQTSNHRARRVRTSTAQAIGFLHILHRNDECLQGFLSCASTATIAPATARVIRSTKFAFAMGTAGVWAPNPNVFSCAFTNVRRTGQCVQARRLARLGCSMLYGCPFQDFCLLFSLAVLAWPPLLPASSENVLLFLSVFLCSAAGAHIWSLTIGCCAALTAQVRLHLWRKDFTGATL